MLHKNLIKKIEHEELTWAYTTDIIKLKDDPTILNFLKEYIPYFKKTVMKYPDDVDSLQQKQKDFGNKGGYAAVKLKEIYEKRKTVVFDHRKATVDGSEIGKWHSIEFELIFKSRAAQDEFAAKIARKKYHTTVSIKDDGSLRRNEDDYEGMPREVVVSYKAGNEQFILDVCEMLKEYAYVNKTCGTHVHFDMRNCSLELASELACKLGKWVPVLRNLIPHSRRTSQYCRTDLDLNMDDRYTFVNLSAFKKYKTIEVRGHSGTLNGQNILNWIALCEQIMKSKSEAIDDAILPKASKEMLKVFLELFKFTPEMESYIQRRFKRFSNAAVELEE